MTPQRLGDGRADLQQFTSDGDLERGEKRTSETPEIARFYETQAQLPSGGGPKAELEDRINCDERKATK